ncbi:MAG: PIG-L family deacetylase [Bacteroidota bacterium]
MTVRRFSLFALLLFATAPAFAQSIDEPEPLVVMNLAAHPDDEDGNTLAHYRWAHDAVAYSVIYTRGEGGQNEIGPDLYEKLGAIRTEETERAGRILGAQVRFLNFYDFGYSKSAAESFAAWGGRDAVTARLVRVIRELKPDVIFTNHDTLTVGPRTQHGHHQAVGLSAYDAFALAADPSFHPEHLAEPGVDLWQPKRLFLRKWRFGGTDAPPDVSVPVGETIPGRDLAATDIAVEAVAEHRSQGFDKFAPRFRRQVTDFQLLRSAPGIPALPDEATDLADDLAPNRYANALPLAALLDMGRLTASLRDGEGLRPQTERAVPGQTVPLYWRFGTRFSPGGRPSPVELVFTGAVDTVVTVPPEASMNTEPIAFLHVPPDARPTLPKAERQYDRLLSTPPVQYAIRLPGQPEAIYTAEHLTLEIAAPITVELPDGVIRLMPGENTLDYRIRIDDPDVSGATVQLVIAPPAEPNVRVRPLVVAEQTVGKRAGWTDETFAFTLPDDIPVADYELRLEARPAPTPTRYAPTTATRTARPLPRVEVADGLRVGFVKSYDETTEYALRTMGATVVPLDSAMLASGDLSDLHTVVVDIRAYLVRSDLRRYNERLLDWVRAGGHLVVTYQKTFEWNEQYDDPFDETKKNPAGFAPYPLLLGRDRVTVEEAPVTLLEPEHVLFRAPNATGPDVWDGWVQERGLYFPAGYDDRYVELLAMNDPGEDPLPSSTLLAEVGEGTYLYTALGWYRQLAVYNPGAYRLFANLVSLPLVDGR